MMTALFTACSSDDDFNADIAAPRSSDPTEAQSFGDGAVASVPVISLAEVTEETVQIANITMPTPTSATAKLESMTVQLTYMDEEGNTTVYETPITTDGYIDAAFFTKDVIEASFGKRPVERTVVGQLAAIYKDDTQTLLYKSDVFAVTAIPEAPVIEDAYYLTGTINGWDNTNTDYVLTNDGSDPYANPTFTCRIPAPADGSSVEFKMTPKSGLGGDFNMLDQTWSYAAVSFSDYIYLACDFNGWSTSASPLVHLGDGAYEGFYYIQEADEASTWGFKFVIDGAWSGGAHSVATSGSFVLGGGDDNLNCPTGFYQVKVNQANNTYELVAVNTISLIGSAVNGDSSWGTDADMTFSTADGCWVYDGPLTAGEFKFRMNHDWTISWGGSADALTNQNGANIALAADGNYIVKFWPNCNGKGVYTINAK